MDKKQPLKYGIAKQADVDKMFKKSSTTSTRPTRETLTDEGVEMPSIAECVAETNKLGGVYKLVDPIDTIVGPIGRFPAVPEALPKHAAMVGFGKRRTGKTFTFRDIFYKCLRHIPFGIVVTRTKMNGFWQTYVPPRFVFSADNMTHVIGVLIARQTKLIDAWKKENPEKVKESPDAYKDEPSLAAFCILDDVISDQAAMIWNTQLTSLFVEGRHLCITVCILSQYPKGIGPKIRGNADIVVLQPIYDYDQVEMLAHMYNGGLDRKIWKKLMGEIVKDEIQKGATPLEAKKEVRTMFISDFENSKNPQIKFHYYEAEDPGPFRLCDKEYWKEGVDVLGKSEKVDELDIEEELEMVGMGVARIF